MRNLAGDANCDRFIRVELEAARIPVEHAPAHRSEVPYTLMGRLGGIVLTRAWYYWVAKGQVPLSTAEELYDDPVGRTDVRVAGYAGGAPPAEWAVWLTPDGTRVGPADQEAGYVDFMKNHPGLKIGKELFSDNPEELGARQVIDIYHIDTQEGLTLFADTLRAHSLAGETS